MLCDVDAGPASDEHVANMETLANAFANDSATNFVKFI